jgi:hypothetical protein
MQEDTDFEESSEGEEGEAMLLFLYLAQVGEHQFLVFY